MILTQNEQKFQETTRIHNQIKLLDKCKGYQPGVNLTYLGGKFRQQKIHTFTYYNRHL